MKREESGIAEWILALAISGAIFVVLGGIAVVQDLNQAKSGTNGWRPGGGGPPPTLSIEELLFVGPTPTDPGKKCIIEKMAARGFTFGAGGWRSPSFNPPERGFDERVYRGQIAAWKGPFEKIVNEDLAEVKKVCQAPEQTLKLTTTTAAIVGRYRIDIPENQNCSGPVGKLQTQIRTTTASGEGSGFTLNIDGLGALNGSLKSDQRFDVKGSPGLEPGVAIRMEGQFVPFGDTVLIRSGELTITTPSETCTTSFSGERLKP